MRESSFKKKEHLKDNSSIKDVLHNGIPFKGRLINIFLLKRNQGPRINRAAFIIQRNLYQKKLVLRNRFRRVLREAYRRAKHILAPGFDIVILATRLKKDTKSLAVEKELRHVFEKSLEK